MTFDTAVRIKKESIAEQVYRYVKRMILSGSIKTGERIPEEKIAQVFEVSRTPIREALKRLSEYGLIEKKSNRNFIVSNFSLEDANHIAVIRSQLECLSLRLFVKTATTEDLEAIEKIAEKCVELSYTNNQSAVFEKDSELHLEIARRTNNPFLFEMLERLDAKVQLIRLTVCMSSETVVEDTKQHIAIIEEIRNKDSRSAVALMEQHILHHFRNLSREVQIDGIKKEVSNSVYGQEAG